MSEMWGQVGGREVAISVSLISFVLINTMTKSNSWRKGFI